MYRSEKSVKGTFRVELESDEKRYELSLFSPKLRSLKKFSKLDDASEDAMDETAECISEFLSHNRDGIKVSAEEVLDIFDFEDMTEFLNDFFSWAEEIKKK